MKVAEGGGECRVVADWGLGGDIRPPNKAGLPVRTADDALSAAILDEVARG